jgi:hypothetical protein
VAKSPCDAADDHEGQCQKQWWKLNHRSPLWRSVTDGSIGSVVHTLAQVLARLEVRHVFS